MKKQKMGGLVFLLSMLCIVSCAKDNPKTVSDKEIKEPVESASQTGISDLPEIFKKLNEIGTYEEIIRLGGEQRDPKEVLFEPFSLVFPEGKVVTFVTQTSGTEKKFVDLPKDQVKEFISLLEAGKCNQHPTILTDSPLYSQVSAEIVLLNTSGEYILLTLRTFSEGKATLTIDYENPNWVSGKYGLDWTRTRKTNILSPELCEKLKEISGWKEVAVESISDVKKITCTSIQGDKTVEMEPEERAAFLEALHQAKPSRMVGEEFEKEYEDPHKYDDIPYEVAERVDADGNIEKMHWKDTSGVTRSIYEVLLDVVDKEGNTTQMRWKNTLGVEGSSYYLPDSYNLKLKEYFQEKELISVLSEDDKIGMFTRPTDFKQYLMGDLYQETIPIAAKSESNSIQRDEKTVIQMEDRLLFPESDILKFTVSTASIPRNLAPLSKEEMQNFVSMIEENGIVLEKEQTAIPQEEGDAGGTFLLKTKDGMYLTVSLSLLTIDEPNSIRVWVNNETEDQLSVNRGYIDKIESSYIIQSDKLVQYVKEITGYQVIDRSILKDAKSVVFRNTDNTKRVELTDESMKNTFLENARKGNMAPGGKNPYDVFVEVTCHNGQMVHMKYINGALAIESKYYNIDQQYNEELLKYLMDEKLIDETYR